MPQQQKQKSSSGFHLFKKPFSWLKITIYVVIGLVGFLIVYNIIMTIFSIVSPIINAIKDVFGWAGLGPNGGSGIPGWLKLGLLWAVFSGSGAGAAKWVRDKMFRDKQTVKQVMNEAGISVEGYAKWKKVNNWKGSDDVGFKKYTAEEYRRLANEAQAEADRIKREQGESSKAYAEAAERARKANKTADEVESEANEAEARGGGGVEA